MQCVSLQDFYLVSSILFWSSSQTNKIKERSFLKNWESERKDQEYRRDNRDQDWISADGEKVNEELTCVHRKHMRGTLRGACSMNSLL